MTVVLTTSHSWSWPEVAALAFAGACVLAAFAGIAWLVTHRL